MVDKDLLKKKNSKQITTKLPNAHNTLGCQRPKLVKELKANHNYDYSLQKEPFVVKDLSK